MPRLEINTRRRAFMQDVRGDRHRVGQKLPQRVGRAVAVSDVQSGHCYPFSCFVRGAPPPRTCHRSSLPMLAGPHPRSPRSRLSARESRRRSSRRWFVASGYHSYMHRIRPARLKPGVSADSIVAPTSSANAATTAHTIRGKALIFWDLKVLGKKKKLDAIDTDQITPAADCVSESLETLDERWKAGAFRYLMPDFRARVHRGETFVIAGDRFAIGSSREMSPAGLKAIADEMALEMVIVCGHNMGDIFRRNALNLGLHVVQSPDAVADARDGDELTFDPVSRRLTNETQRKTYDPAPLSAKEDEIRRTGGIFAAGRREFKSSVETTPRI